LYEKKEASILKIALKFYRDIDEDSLGFAKQLGVKEVIMKPSKLPGENHWEFIDLLQLRTRLEAHGLNLAAIEGIPWRFYYKAMFGLPGRDEQIENLCKTVRNIGAAGIPILGYGFSPLGVWRTSAHTIGRGGAYVTSFDSDLAKRAPLMARRFNPGTIEPEVDPSLIPESHHRPIGDDEMWENFTYFINAVAPVARQSNVRLALHPDDPPVPSLGGVARIFRSVDAFQRVLEIVPDGHQGIQFCQGCFTEMGADVIEAIRNFGGSKGIVYVHFRDVIGTAERFQECFVDEGPTNMLATAVAYQRAGFEGVMSLDHTPHIVGDTVWGHRGRAYAVGYMRALIEAAETICDLGS
jgi:mannonate dehydratase